VGRAENRAFATSIGLLNPLESEIVPWGNGRGRYCFEDIVIATAANPMASAIVTADTASHMDAPNTPTKRLMLGLSGQPHNARIKHAGDLSALLTRC
jgi:hypothetical protein